ncbi:PD-(D/E)XK nuclease family protein [Desulfopila sp. IMCC35008]|uniref:RecB family exonuclease n=1 Tax=Desulfopila sp. IMCC35008 TaxID=2653858 RepID=UPI0013D5C787|nr:PD-(D/E)XK nuclease family protein [Desulfopila sp. IMCC35008]
MSQAIQTLRDQLHISHSQLFTYINCSLKYWFNYVQRVPGKHSSIALHFGKAIHGALEAYYTALQQTGDILPLSELESVFASKFYQSMELVNVPILYKKDMPDTPSAIFMGNKMLQAFHKEISLDGYTIEAVELPLSAPLYNHNAEPQDIQLIGIIDLLLRDNKGNLVVVDHKTSKQAKSQSSVDEDLQTTAYSYLLAANRYVFPRAEVQGRFDVLRKLKTPKFEQYHTSRGPTDRKRFAKLSAAVLAGIENRVFIPCRSWLYTDCEFSESCHNW